jgi:hypothetical protein
MMLDVTIRLASGPVEAVVRGKLDTGADITVVPEGLLRDLRANPVGQMRIRSAQERISRFSPIFSVAASIDGSRFFPIHVVNRPKDYALVGLDLLNHHVLHADGPAGVFELTAPR